MATAETDLSRRRWEQCAADFDALCARLDQALVRLEGLWSEAAVPGATESRLARAKRLGLRIVTEQEEAR